MFSIFLSWIVIGMASLILGYTFICTFYRNKSEALLRLDVFILCGLMLINVYSEVFSLFYKVGGRACLVLAGIGIICLLLHSSRNKEKYVDTMKKMRDVPIWQWMIFVFSLIAMLAWTVGYPTHYDTALYHQQAINWIEEYGVVPGLGNLHNRFAYNSAFMPLQALFSFKWLTGQSLHTVNGFLCWFFLVYALETNNLFKGKPLQLSDCLKIAMVVYIFLSREYISSPTSDIMALLLVLYLCTKWSEFEEEKCDDVLAYTFLCVLGVWAISVKLSVATCIILAIYPLTILIRKKMWREMFLNLILGITVMLPWLMRNVVISGYLLYPYPSIDFFDVDWKMPRSILEYDSREIMVWGRAIRDVGQFELPIWKWFPNWWKENNLKCLIIFGIFSVICLVVYLCIKIIKRNHLILKKDILIVYSVIGILAWLFSAPLMRYGVVYLLLPISIVVNMLWNHIGNYNKLLKITETVGILILFPILSLLFAKITVINDISVLRQENYEWRLTQETVLQNEIKVWIPVEGDQGSYDVFPCVPYANMVAKIELRGEGLQDGFRVMEEYRNTHLSEYGDEW